MTYSETSEESFTTQHMLRAGQAFTFIMNPHVCINHYCVSGADLGAGYADVGTSEMGPIVLTESPGVMVFTSISQLRRMVYK